MLNNKKAMSGIILTVIMIGLVLVAVGIVWYVIANILTTQTEGIDYASKCLGLVFTTGPVVCAGSGDNWDCNVTITRFSGQGEIQGVTMVLSNDESQDSAEASENILTTTRVTLEDIEINATKADNVKAYFIKEDGTKHYC